MNLMRRTYSLSTKLSTRLLVTTGLILLGVVSAIGVFSYKYIRDDARANAIGALKSVTEEMNSTIALNEYILNGSSWLISENIDNPKYISKVTHNIMSTNNILEGCMLAFTNVGGLHGFRGKCLCSYRTDDGALVDTVFNIKSFDSSQEFWFHKVLTTEKPQWGEPFYEEENGRKQFHITYSLPIFNEKGNAVAVFATKMSMKGMTDMLMSLRPYENSYSGMLDTAMIYASFPDSTDVLRFPLTILPQPLSDRLIEEQRRPQEEQEYSSMDFMGFDGSRKFAVFGPLMNRWYVMTVSQYSDVFETLIKIARIIIIISIMMMAMLLIFTRKTVRRFTQPITQFTFKALNVSKGNFDVKFPENMQSTELCRLRYAMTNMLAAVKNYIQELRTSVAANERYESELNIAKDIQRAMLPVDFPCNEKVDIYATLTPAKEVGGDLYNFKSREDKVYFSVGDVSGKGVPAALLMAITREAFKFVSDLGLEMNQIIGKINNAFCEGNFSNMFITLFAGNCNLKTGKMKFCNAGHNPIVVVPPDGKAYLLRAKPNLAAGLFPDFPYEKEELDLLSGTRLVLYTDGVTEAEAADKSQFGEQRLLEFASSQPADMSSEEFVRKLEDAIHEFVGANPQNDDITIMSVKFKTEFKA